jgi:hypothetical protein
MASRIVQYAETGDKEWVNSRKPKDRDQDLRPNPPARNFLARERRGQETGHGAQE